MSRQTILLAALGLVLLVAAFVFVTAVMEEDGGDDFDYTRPPPPPEAPVAESARRKVDRAAETPEEARVTANVVGNGLAEVVGRAADLRSGRPISGLLVDVMLERDAGFRNESVATDETGSFAARELEPSDRVYVSFRGDGFGTRVLGPFALYAGDRHDLGTVELGPGGAMLGRVLDTAGTPVAGASVMIRPLSPPGSLNELLLNLGRMFQALPPVARAATGQTGEYRLDGVPSGSYHVTVSASGFGDLHRTDVWINEKGLPTRLDVVLQPGAVLAGRVVDGEDRPLSNVRVCVMPTLNGRDLSAIIQRAQGRTGEDGRFSITGLEPGGKDVLLMRPDGLYALKERVPAPGRDIELRLAGATVITGRVIREDDERPVAGARLTFAGKKRFVSTETDEQGRYRIGPVDEKGWRIVPDVPGLVVRAEDFILDTEGRTEVEHDIRLTAGAVISGRVIDDVTEHPVPAAEVTASEHYGQGAGIARAITGSDGRFRLAGVPLGKVRIFARADGFGFDPGEQRRHNPRWKDLASGREVTDVVVRLRRSVTVRGRVLGPSGPVVGARVSTTTDGAFQSAIFGVKAVNTVTDRDGLYTVAATVRDGKPIILRATHPDYAPVAKPVPGEPRGGEELALDLDMEPGVTVAGEVVRLTGEPIAGAVVRARLAQRGLDLHHEQQQARFGLLARTGGDGRWRLRLPRGKALLEFAASGYMRMKSRRVKLDLSPGPPVRVDPVHFARRSFFGGTVLDTDGRPVSGAGAVLVRRPDDGFGWQKGVPVHKGRFRIDPVPEGFYDLYVLPGGTNTKRYREFVPTLSRVAAGRDDLRITARPLVR